MKSVEFLFLVATVCFCLPPTLRAEPYAIEAQTHLSPQLELHETTSSVALDLGQRWQPEGLLADENEGIAYMLSLLNQRPVFSVFNLRSELSDRMFPVFALIAASPYGAKLLSVFLPRFLSGEIPIFPLTPKLQAKVKQIQPHDSQRVTSLISATRQLIYLKLESELGWLTYQLAFTIHRCLDQDYLKATSQLDHLDAAATDQKKRLRQKMRWIPEDDVDISDPELKRAHHDYLQTRKAFDLLAARSEVIARRTAYAAAYRIVRELSDQYPQVEAYYRGLPSRSALPDFLEPLSDRDIYNQMLSKGLSFESLSIPDCGLLVGEAGDRPPPPQK